MVPHMPYQYQYERDYYIGLGRGNYWYIPIDRLFIASEQVFLPVGASEYY